MALLSSQTLLAGPSPARRSAPLASPCITTPLAAPPSHTSSCCWPACNRTHACSRVRTRAPTLRCQASAQVGGDTRTIAAYQVLLTMVARLHSMEAAEAEAQQAARQPGSPHDSLLDKFISARPEVVSVPFLSWLADQEAAAEQGEIKQKLDQLCHRLVVAREVQEQERFEQLHLDTLAVLTDSPGPSSHPHSPALITFGRGAPAAAPGDGLRRGPVRLRAASSTPGAAAAAEVIAAAMAQEYGAPPGRATAQPGMLPNRDAAAAGGRLSEQGTGGEQGTAAEAVVAAVAGSAGQLQGVAGAGLGVDAGHGRADGPQQTGTTSVVQQAPGDVRAADMTYAGGAASGSGSGNSSGSSLSLLQDPVQYAVQLSRAVTGRDVALTGYGPLYDAVIAAAPPAALSPEGLALAHKQAVDLGADLKGRRRRSVASILGRVKVTPEQAAQLMAGSAAARILDLLLSLPDIHQREALLPDCFTPPPPPEAGLEAAAAAVAAAAGSGSRGPDGMAGTLDNDSQGRTTTTLDKEETTLDGAVGAAAATLDGADGDGEGETDELWCTPAQLLSEIDARVKALSGAAAAGGGGGGGVEGGEGMGGPGAVRQLAPVAGQLVGGELRAALTELRDQVNTVWMDRLGQVNDGR